MSPWERSCLRRPDRGLSWRRQISRSALTAILLAASVAVSGTPRVLASTGRAAGIVPLVECVEHAHGGDTFWFGADVDPILPAQLLRAQWGVAWADPTNAIVETADGVVVDRGPGRDQAEFFTPGVHRFMFSITSARGTSWSGRS